MVTAAMRFILFGPEHRVRTRLILSGKFATWRISTQMDLCVLRFGTAWNSCLLKNPESTR